MGFLDCSPSLDGDASAKKLTWEDAFYQDPVNTVNKLFTKEYRKPADSELKDLCLTERVSGPSFPYGTLPQVLVISQDVITKFPTFLEWLHSTRYTRMRDPIFHSLFSEGYYDLEVPMYFEMWSLASSS